MCAHEIQLIFQTLFTHKSLCFNRTDMIFSELIKLYLALKCKLQNLNADNQILRYDLIHDMMHVLCAILAGPVTLIYLYYIVELVAVATG